MKILLSFLTVVCISLNSMPAQDIIPQDAMEMDDFGMSNLFAFKHKRVKLRTNQKEVLNSFMKNLKEENSSITKILFYPKFYGCKGKRDLSKVFKAYLNIISYLEVLDKNSLSNVSYEIIMPKIFCHENGEGYWAITVVPVVKNSTGEEQKYKFKR